MNFDTQVESSADMRRRNARTVLANRETTRTLKDGRKECLIYSVELDQDALEVLAVKAIRNASNRTTEGACTVVVTGRRMANGNT